jgi:NADPH-dependent 2,4-dienoyl-CoA reductase/sulfur reductase-like enzyme
MKETKYLLIGGGLTSSQAAKEIRDADPDGPILLVGEEPHVPYDRPPLSKEFLRGEKAREELFFDPESSFREQRIDLALGTRVDALDPAARQATLSSGERVAFGKALLATGGSPIRLELPGAGLPGVHTLRTIDDSEAIAKGAAPGARVAIVGAGFIGLEVAASLTRRGAHVTVIEVHPRIWPRFADAGLASFIQRRCEAEGVTFLLGETVAAFRGAAGRVAGVALESGKELACELAIVGVGITPNVALARDAGLAVENGVVVNERLQTSHPDVYAAGDIANYPDPIAGRRRRVEHWGHAEYCGQVAGANMAGGDRRYDLVTYVWSDLFDLHLEFAGDESESDETLFRGKLEDAAFLQLHLRKGALTAYFAINASARDFPVLQKLIRTRKDLSGRKKELADPAFALRGLL